MKTFTVTQNSTLKDFTDASYPQASFCFSALLRGKDIKVNGVRVRADVQLKAGDTVEYYTTPAQEAKLSHYTVFEDENILVADKFSGVSSEGLTSELNLCGKYLPVHRLDRNTSGLIVYAKTAAAESALLKAFRARKAEKIYLAVCKNNFSDKNAVLRARLLKDEKSGTVKINRDSGAEIVTEYSVLEERGDIALVKVTLHTGKTHQIRAHLAYIGCPVLGDEKYGDRALNDKYSARRQRLVAKYLRLYTDGDFAYLCDKVFESSFSPQLN